MALSDVDIRRMMNEGKIKIKPFKPEQLGSASVDLTLSNEWWFFKKSFIEKQVDLAKVGFKQATEKVIANTVILLPGQMCLGKTAEKITLGPDVIGQLEGRSRFARMGLAVHVTSAIVQPGSDNHQVLEIVNFAPFSVVLHKGMKISQVLFDETKTKSSKPYKKFGKIARVQ
ncbi:MAG: dCTP deaminase [Candidatus Micrarchaeia archaeon]|jgi:dCTP deaminase